MKSLKIKNRILLLNIAFYSCCFIACLGNKSLEINGDTTIVSKEVHSEPILVGANQTGKYLPLLNNKRIAVVANQTSVVFKNEQQNQYTHLVDSLLSLGINIKKVFAPEHGFRGTADAGELIKDGIDTKTGLPIISLYGNNKKPTKDQLENIDLIIFDIQDVGARFYTYISTLHYVMEACAEYNIDILVLDRPNPNGHYVDGPILESEHQSFVGMHPVPVVHGMTIGEYAQMINGEGWLINKINTSLTVIPVANYNKGLPYSLPIKPSPNLPNDTAINLYPSLCFFEGTNVNAGRGTSKQFQLFGSPYLDSAVFNFSYTPQPNEGAKNPKHNGSVCYGLDLSNQSPLNYLDLSFLIMAYQNTSEPSKFFNDFFTKLAGNTSLKQQIESGMTAGNIKKTWEKGLSNFIKMRQPYLLYN
jgi:uncharacterized protein YbbC (DUF1343 family)